MILALPGTAGFAGCSLLSSLPIRAPRLAVPTAQARMTRARGRQACDQNQYPNRQWYELVDRAKNHVGRILLVPMAACAHVPPPKFQDSGLCRPMAWPGTSARLPRRVWPAHPYHGHWHMCASGEPLSAAGTQDHTPAWPGSAHFALRSYYRE